MLHHSTQLSVTHFKEVLIIQLKAYFRKTIDACAPSAGFDTSAQSTILESYNSVYTWPLISYTWIWDDHKQFTSAKCYWNIIHNASFLVSDTSWVFWKRPLYAKDKSIRNSSLISHNTWYLSLSEIKLQILIDTMSFHLFIIY